MLSIKQYMTALWDKCKALLRKKITHCILVIVGKAQVFFVLIMAAYIAFASSGSRWSWLISLLSHRHCFLRHLYVMEQPLLLLSTHVFSLPRHVCSEKGLFSDAKIIKLKLYSVVCKKCYSKHFLTTDQSKVNFISWTWTQHNFRNTFYKIISYNHFADL